MADENANQPRIEVVDPGSVNDPFKPGGATESSPVVSTAGAPAEPAAPGSEGSVAPPASTTDASQVPAAPGIGDAPAAPPGTATPPVAPGPSPVVQVIPAGTDPATVAPAPAAAPAVEPAQAQPAPAATPAPGAPTDAVKPDDGEGLKSLADAMRDIAITAADEATSAVQSKFDKRTSVLQGELDAANAATKALRDENRELGLRELTEEEKVTARAKYAQDDEAEALKAEKARLNAFHSELMVESLLFEFREFDIDADTLKGFQTPEEMEAYCYEQKANARDKEIESLKANPPAAPAATEQTPVAPAAAPAPAASAVPNVPAPAGAEAPTDIGSGGSAPDPGKMDETPGADSMQKNLRGMGWDTVRINTG